MQSPPPSNGDEDHDEAHSESLYNDGKGIKVSLCFIPLLPPVKAGSKRRKNAKAKPENRVFYIHEADSLPQLVDLAIEELDKVDTLTYNIGNRSGLFDPDNFSLQYTINRSSDKDIPLESISKYKDLIDEAVIFSRPGFKLVMQEVKALVDGEDDNEIEDEEEDEQSNAKKKKTGPNAEEIEQNENIARLTRLYNCEDRSCSFTTCWPAPPDGNHIHLTHLHLNTWAAAMAANTDGVDLEHPPSTKLFDPTFRNDSDASLLSKRRLAAINQNQSSAPSIVINNDFKELAGALRGDQGPPQPHPARPAATLRMMRPALIPKMTLAVFCNTFDLSDFILQKLDTLKITGPHGLRFVNDHQLSEMGELDIGELADVRDAQERWAMGLGQDENAML